MSTTTQDRVIAHLSTALHEIVAVIVLSGGLPDDIPDDALDAALKIDPAVQEARKGFQDALKTLRSHVATDVLFTWEETVNALAARTAETGFRVGLLQGRAEAS